MLLAFDLDGTLLPDTGRTIPAATAEALARLRALGVKIAIITGRDVVPPTVLDAIHPHGIATNNGGRIIIDDHVHAEATFTPEDLRAVLDHALPGARVVAFGRDALYLDHPRGEELAPWLKERDTRPLSDAVNDTILKVGFYHPNVHEHAGTLRGSHPHLTLTGAQAPYPEFLTVTPQDAHKGAALSALAAALGVPLADTVAFGDSDNDVAMLSIAGRAVQVGDLPLLRDVAHETVSGPDTLAAYLTGLADGLEAEQQR
ncbi:HAD hydrolase family protein [Deinococcus maricopensis]|uniref:HAD-superfamily hydrolase, subfamily IIB n=1 Tax=Deinococcus maricopensis (strain DSM 21211 / LMG 22137 / NRRL B-23946 / LB-34) TaxID=709986 RepID=E8UAS4_DEIML|nr:HAD family hydrolase [Deinococcus maricopensis]ADV68163.1 HAD-superfamily hydrolase, subfamily IIB [Deinococcus maricopensis DSM 21211]